MAARRGDGARGGATEQAAPAAAPRRGRRRKRKTQAKDLEDEDEDMFKDIFEAKGPELAGDSRGGGASPTAPEPQQPVERIEEIPGGAQPSGAQGMEVEVEDPYGDRWPDEPSECKITYRCIIAQSSRAPGGLPKVKARQRFPTLPKWFFEDGRLREPKPKWDGETSVWVIQLRQSRGDPVTLEGVNLQRYASAYQEVVGVPLTLGLPPSGPSGR